MQMTHTFIVQGNWSICQHWSLQSSQDGLRNFLAPDIYTSEPRFGDQGKEAMESAYILINMIIQGTGATKQFLTQHKSATWTRRICMLHECSKETAGRMPRKNQPHLQHMWLRCNMFCRHGQDMNPQLSFGLQAQPLQPSIEGRGLVMPALLTKITTKTHRI